MKKILKACLIAVAALVAAINTYGQGGAQAANQAEARPAQNRMIGAVTAVDAAAMQVTIRTDEGALVQVALNDRTSILRVPPGETDPSKAVKIGLAEVAVGDRLFARGAVAADGKSVAARQVVITSGAAVSTQQGEREAERRRRVVGRITALDAATREISVLARSREGGETITIAAPVDVRLLRYAPDSLNPRDAKPGSFADLKVGDQIRAQGERSADGKRFTAEEIISGAFQRIGGTVTAVNAAANEITVRNEQTGKSLTITVGQKSTLRRVTPEAAASFGERVGRRADRRPGGAAAPEQQSAQGGAQVNDGGGRSGDGRGEGRGWRQRAGGRNFQETLESLPAITIADLKKGDVVLVNGTAMGADPSRVTAVTLLTGEAEFLNRLQRFQGGPNRDRQMNPGLPGDVLGTGTGNNRDQP